VISLKSQSFFRINFEFSIPGKAFYPEPKTRSVVITTEPLSVKDYEKCPEKYVLKEIFLQSKKKLKNALTEGIINLNKNILSRDFTKNMARETIKKMKLKGGMLDKGVEKIRTADFENLLEKLSLL
jgi:16S rRNA A1518/A1519 N6-dimethyltransferase RsmA/KsgA/DIM1 with predicted DNA glycosylase/AP lyase activity